MGLHVALIGGGMVARVHLDALATHPDVTAISLAELDRAAQEAMARQYPLRRVESDYRRLLEDPTIDVVDICLPHDLHHPVGLAALEAGKHVLSEKPIALTLQEADELIAAAERAGKRYFVALNQRFLPAHAEARRLLHEGAIGRPFMATVTIIGNELERMNQPGHWKGSWERAGGGVLADTGTHAVDLMLWWFGAPDRVTCRWQRTVVEAEDKGDDTTVVVMEYSNGPLVTLAMTYAATDPWSERKRVYGTSGSLHVVSEDAEPLVVFKEGERRVMPVEHDPNWWPYSVKRGVHHFVDCLVHDWEFSVTPQDARETLRVILDAYRAAQGGHDHADWIGSDRRVSDP